MAILTKATIPLSADKPTAPMNSDLRDSIIQLNNLIVAQAALARAFTSDGVLKGIVPSTGTTNTLATSAGIITIAGVPVAVPATTANAIGATLCTVKALLWGIIGIDAVAAGTITNVGVAGNAAGFATEAAAIAAAPAKTANKARVGYITLVAGATDWVGGTDGLALGSGGTVATTTNFYSVASPWELTTQSANAVALGSIAFTAKQIANLQGTVVTATT